MLSYDIAYFNETKNIEAKMFSKQCLVFICSVCHISKPQIPMKTICRLMKKTYSSRQR